MTTFTLLRPAIAALLVLGLSGCTPGAPTPTQTPTAPVTSTPSPTVAPASVPQPRWDLTCDALADALPLAATFNAPVAAVARAATEYGAHPSMPEEYVVRHLGGLVCEFSNGVPQSAVRGTSPNYVGVRILVLPDAQSGWDRYAASYDVTGTRSVFCYTVDSGSACDLNARVGTTWIDAMAAGAVSDAAATALVDAVVAAVASAGPGAAPWTPPVGPVTLPSTCPPMLSPAELSAATGLVGPFDVVERFGGGWSLRGAAMTTDDSPSCMMAFEGSDAGIGTIATLRGGSWAWAEARDLVGSRAITVAGLGSDDQAWLRCGSGDAWCVVDMVLGDHWVEVYLWEDDPGSPLDRRAAIQAIAAEIVANVRP